MTRYCGRDFNEDEILQIRRLIISNSGFHRAELSRHVCRILQWFKPDGGLKDMSCRVAMLRMHKDGIINLPPPLKAKPALRKLESTSATDPQIPIIKPVHQLGTLKFCAGKQSVPIKDVWLYPLNRNFRKELTK